MHIIDTALPDVKLLCPECFGDERGWFMETFREAWFREQVADTAFVQDNHSYSVQGVLRGLHYQTVRPQGKLVRVLSGAVFDVAVDMRQGSPFFGRWTAAVLSADNRLQMWIPPGFAHGFYVLRDTELAYRCTDYYCPEAEQCLRWDDASLAIDWPLSGRPLLSDKDRAGRPWADAPYFD